MDEFLARRAGGAIIASCFLGLLLLFPPQVCAHSTDAPEDLRQRILAGEQISFNPSTPEDARKIDAKWIKEAALRHVSIEVYNAVIQGPFDAQDVTFELQFKLTRCVFVGYADFSNAVFRRNFWASEVTFRSGVSFQGASFDRMASFSGSRFEVGPVTFDDAHFIRVFDASGVTFVDKNSAATFNHVRFDGNASFSSSLFVANANFITAQFGAEGDFRGVTFGGPADFRRAHFAGPATFGMEYPNKGCCAKFARVAIFFETQFDSKVSFDGATFEDEVYFSSAKFGSRAQFLGTIFKSNCDFSMTRFGDDGWFMGASFLGSTSFAHAHFAGSLTFEAGKRFHAAMFRGEAQFIDTEVENFVNFGGGEENAPGVVFAGKVMFNGAKFAGPSSFQGVRFKGEADFLDARFGNDVYFHGATFEGDALFDRVQIMGAALFRPKESVVTSNFAQSAHFVRKTSFLGAHFGSGVRFIGVNFDGTTDFSETHFEGDAHFEDSVFLGASSFRSAVFRVVYFTTAEMARTKQFMNNVDLLGCTYDRIQIDWRSLLRYPNGQSRIHPYDRQPYIELESVLRRSGSDEDADEVYAERRRVENLTLRGWRKSRDRSYWLIANYGVDLWHEFTASLLCLGIGMLIFSRPQAVRTGQGESHRDTKIFWYQALPMAVHQFLPFGLPVKSRWTPSDRVLFRYLPWPFRKAASYANFLQIVGWILIPLAAAVLAGFLRHGAQ